MDVYGWDKKHRHEFALLGEMLHIEAAGQPNTTVCGKQAHASSAPTKRPYTGSDAWLA